MAFSASSESIPLTGNPARPIVWWAGIGFFFVSLEIYIFGSWILSDKFTPTDPGPSPLPGYTELFITFFEGVGLVLGIGVLLWFARLAWRRQALPAAGVLILGWLTAFWQDPLINYFRPNFTYNSYFNNFGSWSEFIPGWRSPNGSKMPEPLFFDFGVYLFVIPFGCFVCAFALRKAKKRWPHLNTVQLILIAFAAMFFYDLILEAIWVRSGVYAYPGAIWSLSLWGGEHYQFPIYESIFWGAALAAVGSLYYFRDDKGHMLVERGIEKLKSVRGQTILRILAVGGFVNMAYLTYSILYLLTTFQIDAWPDNYPSHIRNGLCGIGTDYECPGPDVHIPIKGSGPLPPYTGRN